MTSSPSPLSSGAALGGRALRPLTVPILVSATANLLAGYLWFLASCFGPFISAPLLVLATFELWTAVRTPREPEDLRRRATTLGLLELLAGVFNLVSLVCGTLVLLNLGRVERNLRGHEPPRPP